MTGKERKLLVVAGGVFIVALLIFLANLLSANDFFHKHYENDLTPNQRKSMIHKCQKLKKSLQSWAIKNKIALQTMLRASTSDFKANQLIWDSCPAIPTRVNSDDKELVFKGSEVHLSDLNPEGEMHVGTICGADRLEATMDVRAVAKDPEYWKYRKQGDIIRENRRRTYWEKYHDVPLWEVTAPGNEQFILFVSGRIVSRRTPPIAQSISEVAKSRGEIAELTEVEPVYTFLKD